MNNKSSNSNIIISIFAVLFTVITFLMVFQNDILVEENNKIDKREQTNKKSVAYNFTGSERDDIVGLAKEQDGTIENRAANNGYYTKYHIWADNYYPNQDWKYGAAYVDYWCQMFNNWLGVQVGVDTNYYSVNDTGASTTFTRYGNWGRADSNTNNIEPGWLVYEYFKGSAHDPSHVGLYVGNNQYVHGNYHKGDWIYGAWLITGHQSTHVCGYAQPYYRAKIFYEMNGGKLWGKSGKVEHYEKYTEEKEYTDLPPSTAVFRDGFEFTGWYWNSACTEQATSIPTYRNGNKVRGNQTLYAGWKESYKTIHYDAGDGTFPSKNSRYYDETYYPGKDTGKYLVTEPFVQREWCYLEGWWWDAPNGIRYNVKKVQFNWNTDITLKARWLGKPFKISLYSNGGTVKSSYYGETTKNRLYEYTSNYQTNKTGYLLPTLAGNEYGSVDRFGYHFRGWYRDNNTFTDGPVTQNPTNNGDNQTYYAKWEPKEYPIILYPNKGTVKGSAYTENQSRGTVRTGGYTGHDFVNDGSLHYYTSFSKNYIYDTFEVLPKQSLTRPGIWPSDNSGDVSPWASVDRRGHKLMGWYISNTSGSYRTDELNASHFAGFADNQPIYLSAFWWKLTYGLTFHLKGGTILSTSINNASISGDDLLGSYTYSYGSTFPTKSNEIEKNGSIFAGWFNNSNHNGETIYGLVKGDFTTAPIGNREYWARWTQILPPSKVPTDPSYDPAFNYSTEVVEGKYYLYIYSTCKVDKNTMTSTYKDLDTGSRYFKLFIREDSGNTTSKPVSVWLSTYPNSTQGNLDFGSGSSQWRFSTTSSRATYNASTKSYTINDNSEIIIKCPKTGINSFLGEEGARKVYVHVKTETGNIGYFPVNLVRRTTYQQH